MIFKDDIQSKLNQEIDKNINAQVFFDTDNFGLSLLKHFPDVTVSLDKFGVVGKGVFEADTLASIESFQIVLDLGSVLFGDQIRISSIELRQPKIMVLVLEDGTANYDIAIETEEGTSSVDEEPTEFSVGIDTWQIMDGHIVYYDLSNKVLLEIKKLDHIGRGDFTQDIFDLSTLSTASGVSFNYDDVNYLNNRDLSADVTLNMNLPQSVYTFKDNTIRMNEFSFGFDGSIAMPEEAIAMDLTFSSQDNQFRNVLSLIPAVYTEDFNNLTTEGTLQFDGSVRGTYDEAQEQMPGFTLNLLVENGMFSYPDLPKNVSDVNVDLSIINESGKLEETLIDLKDFKMNMGTNPINGFAKIEGLGPMKIDSKLMARINLADFNQMIPMEGLTVRGMYNLDLTAKGTYDSISESLPAIDAVMSLSEGFVKSSEFPATLESISFQSSIQNNTGQMEETIIRVSDFSMLLDGEAFNANLLLQNMVDYNWELDMKGTVDLEKISQIMELEDMTLRGKIIANVDTKGKMSDVEAERYQNLPTRGSASVTNFYFESPDLPQGFSIDKASMTFNPERLILNDFNGKIGVSDMDLRGYLANYLEYTFQENAVIRGEMEFRSNFFNTNEWMTDEEEGVSDSTAEALEPVIIPKNIDFVLNSSLTEVVYDNLSLKDVKGTILIRDGIMLLDGVKFNSLGGNFAMNGSYDTQIPEDPKFDFGIDIDSLSIQKAYESFNTVKVMAPIAEKVNGFFSTDFQLKGNLTNEMMPEYSTITGGGIIKILNAAVTDSRLISGITNITKLNDTDQVTLKDVVLNAEIKDGRIHFEPFNFNMGNIDTRVVGSNGIDGSLKYDVRLAIPAGEVGEAINNAIASLTGTTSKGSTLMVNLNVGGSYDDPNFKLGKSETQEDAGPAQQVKETVKEEVAEKTEEVKDQVRETVSEKKEEVKEIAEEKAGEVKEDLKEEVDKAKEKAKEKLNNFLKRN